MRPGTPRVAIGLLAAVGAAIATYLLYVRHTGGALVCSTGGCETVQSSRYATLAGVPVAGLALAGFLLIGATALVRAPLAAAAGAAVAVSALLFSAYLLVVQLTVIDAVCQWCVATDCVLTVLTACCLIRLREALTPTPRAARDRARSARGRRGSPGEASA